MKEGGKRGAGMLKDVPEKLESPTLKEMLMFTKKWSRVNVCLAGRRGARREPVRRLLAAERVSE